MEKGKNYIVVLQRGWVLVGTCKGASEDGIYWYFENSATIRNWGTEGIGLEGLADKGPQPSTILDRGQCKRGFPLTSLIQFIEVNMNNKGWQKWFNSK